MKSIKRVGDRIELRGIDLQDELQLLQNDMKGNQRKFYRKKIQKEDKSGGGEIKALCLTLSKTLMYLATQQISTKSGRAENLRRKTVS